MAGGGGGSKFISSQKGEALQVSFTDKFQGRSGSSVFHMQQKGGLKVVLSEWVQPGGLVVYDL